MVNTTAQHLNLGNGAVSRLILKTAGPQIQAAALSQLPPNLDVIPLGSVIETLGYNLPCTKVFHGACQNWDNGAGQCEQVGGQLFYTNILYSYFTLTSICLRFVSFEVFFRDVEVLAGWRVGNPSCINVPQSSAMILLSGTSLTWSYHRTQDAEWWC